jgi:hypothetical protein
MGLLSVFFSCEEKKEVYVYRTEAFEIKEKSFKISLDDAVKKYREYILGKEEVDNELFCRLDLIYGDNYIFKKNWEPYNSKTGYYNLSGIWVNGNTSEIKNVETKENIKVLLDPQKHIPYVKKITQ